MKKIIIYSIIALVLIIAIIGKLYSNKKQNQKEAKLATVSASAFPVQTTRISKKSMTSFIEASGMIEAETDIMLYAETQGRITHVLKKKGDWVGTGETIVRVDDEVLKAQYEMAKLNHDAALRDYKRMESLAKQYAVTKKQLEDMEVMLTKSKSDLTTIKKRLEDTKVKAPVAGYINDDYIEVGMLIGNQTKICNIISPGKLLIKVNLNEEDISGIKSHDTVQILSETYPDSKFRGLVTDIAKKATSTNRFQVEVAILNNSLLKAGMYVQVRFPIKNNNLFLVTRNALKGTYKNWCVFVVKDDVAYQKPVVISRTHGDLVEIKEGLSENDVVVVSGTINLYDGIKVKLINN